MVVPAAPLSLSDSEDVDEDEGEDEVDDESVELEVRVSQLAKVSELNLTKSSASQPAVPRQVLKSVSRPTFCWVSASQRQSVSSMLLQPAFSAAVSKQLFYIRGRHALVISIYSNPNF